MKPASVLLPLLCLVASCRAPAADAAAVAEAAPLYALLPLRNLTPQQDMPGLLTGRLRGLLAARGAEFVPEDQLEEILQRRRIRYVDTVSAASARVIAEETGADYLLLGTLIAYEASYPPRIALSTRVIEVEQGRCVQSSLVALSGDDFTGLLGLGTVGEVDTLAWEVVARVGDMFDEKALPVPPRADPLRLVHALPRPGHLQMRYVEPGFELSPGARVVVLPFENRSAYPQVGLLFVDVLAHAWLQTLGIETVETAELLDALVRARVRSLDEIDPDVLDDVVASVGGRYTVHGTVEHFEPEVPVFEDLYPELEVWLRLVDSETGEFAAGAGLRHRGDDFHRGLGLGSERDPVRLGVTTARELLATLSL